MSPFWIRLRHLGATTIALSVFLMVGFDQSAVRAGHPALQMWKLPPAPPAPADNETTAARVELGKMLFFDTRLSGDGTISCATCHNPLYGWADGLPTAVGIGGEVLGRASPAIVNSAYNSIQMWDGREPSLESQALGPMKAPSEMHTDFDRVTRWLGETPGYVKAFAAA